MNKYLEKIGSLSKNYAGLGGFYGAIVGGISGYNSTNRNRGETTEEFLRRKRIGGVIGAITTGVSGAIVGSMVGGAKDDRLRDLANRASRSVTKFPNHFSSKAFNHVNDAMAHKIALSKLPLAKMHEIEQEYIRTSGSKEPISHIRTVLRQADANYAAHHRTLTGVNSHWSDYINSPEFSKLNGFNKSKQYLYKEARECQNY